MRKSYLEVKNLSKQFQVGQQTLEVFKNINFSIQKGEFICIVGGSGCGKSTLLRALAGLDADHGGKVTIDGEEILKPRKDRGVVFQESRLFPWLTVEENVKFALDEGKEEDKRKKVQEVLELVNLKGFEKHLPKALSGGMAQRTNIARALVNNPPILF
ncbi:ABC transporter ATP-binding protein [Cellulosilyticum ruminicola]|uniref:ABC transporter ATP-binding protein n=1 Tax=Cellulosilyticum ruminicola TaxID=425254 RepID=UPI00278C0093|nr:ATP-binding cassette domain-containing protein [Cellulosilyticum ruminicola]